MEITDAVLPSGSHFVCDPPEVFTDVDYFVLVNCSDTIDEVYSGELVLCNVIETVSVIMMSSHIRSFIVGAGDFSLQSGHAMKAGKASKLASVVGNLCNFGFRITSSDKSYNSYRPWDSQIKSTMICLRREDVNVIILLHPEMMLRYTLATAAAKERNLKRKEDRIKLFESIVGGTSELESVVFRNKDRLFYEF